jgi:hypothetical protein
LVRLDGEIEKAVLCEGLLLPYLLVTGDAVMNLDDELKLFRNSFTLPPGGGRPMVIPMSILVECLNLIYEISVRHNPLQLRYPFEE